MGQNFSHLHLYILTSRIERYIYLQYKMYLSAGAGGRVGIDKSQLLNNDKRYLQRCINKCIDSHFLVGAIRITVFCSALYVILRSPLYSLRPQTGVTIKKIILTGIKYMPADFIGMKGLK